MNRSPEQVVLPEQDALSTAMQELGCAILDSAWPEEQRAQKEQEFDAVVTQGVARAVNRDEREAIALAAPIWRWQLFARPGDPLPDGLHPVCVNNVTGRVEAIMSAGGAKARRHAEKMIRPDLAPLLQERYDNILTNRSVIDEKALRVAEVLPLIQKLRSFSTTHHDGERPLTDVEHLRRTNEIYNCAVRDARWNGQDVDRRYFESPIGHHAVRRSLARLDMEESMQPADEQSGDPWERVRAMMLDALAGQHWDVQDMQVGWDNRDFTVNFMERGIPYSRVESIEEIADIALGYEDRAANLPPVLQTSGELTRLLTFAFTHAGAADYDTELQKAVDYMATKIADVTWSSANTGGDSDSSGYMRWFHSDTLHMLLTGDTSPVIPCTDIGAWAEQDTERWAHMREPAPRSNAGFVDKDTLRVLERTNVGFISTYDEPIGEPRVLIAGSQSLEGVSSQPGACNAEIILPQNRFADMQPVLPGFVLRAAFRQGEYSRYQYERGNNDPFNSPALHERMSSDAQKQLVGMCESIGLKELAQELRQTEDLTPAILTQQLRAHSRYVFDNPTNITNPKSFDQLSGYVVEGSYHCQCTGAAYLLSSLLQKVHQTDPDLHVQVVSGLQIPEVLIDGDASINALEHAQVAVYKGNELLYVVDSTPPAPRMTSFGTAALDSQITFDPVAPIEQIVSPEPPTPLVVAEEVYVERNPALKPTDVTELVYTVLRSQFNARDNRQLAALLMARPAPHDDPGVQAVRLCERDTKLVLPSEVEALQVYVRNIRNLDRTTRKRMGFGHYNESGLDMLADALVQLRRTVSRG